MSVEQLQEVLQSMCANMRSVSPTALIDRLVKLGHNALEASSQLEHCVEQGLIRVTNHRQLSPK